MVLPPLFIGTTRDHYLALFGLASCIGVCAGLAGSWLGAYLGARRAMRSAALSASSGVSSQQLASMMQALDAIAVEVERISEAQRFTAKVLSERPPVLVPRVELRSITPH